MRLRFTLFALFCCFSFSVSAAPRFWVAATASNWNNAANWSATSGGAGGASVPTTGDNVTFDGSGLGNCTVDVGVTIDQITVALAYTGTIDLNGSAFLINGAGAALNFFAGGTINDTPGTSSLTLSNQQNIAFSGTDFGAVVNVTGTNVAIALSVFNAAVTITADLILYNGSIFNGTLTSEQTGATNSVGIGGNRFNGISSFTNSGSADFRLAETNPDTFNAQTTFTNTSTQRIRVCNNSTGNVVNGDVIFNATGAGLGIRFGVDGEVEVGAGATFTVGGSGFTAGELELDNVTQTAATAQTLTVGSGLNMSKNAWGGDVNFTATSLVTDSCRYNGISQLTKTGGGADLSNGGNVFVGNTTITNSGSGSFTMGQTANDTFSANLNLNVSGSSLMNFAVGSGGNAVAGDLTIALSGSSTGFNLATAAAGALTVTGNTTISTTSSANHTIIIAGSGDFTTNNFTMNMMAPAMNSSITVAQSAGSVVTVNGTTNMTNSGTGPIFHLQTLGGAGNITFNGNVTVVNTCTAVLSSVNFNENGVNTFNGNISVTSENANTDGVIFGNGTTGSATLAAGQTISIGGGGFIGGELTFNRFTQLGGSVQSLTLGGTALLESNLSTWNGVIVFSAPQLITTSTTYNGATFLTKTGAILNASAGGNVFNGVTAISNAGTATLRFSATNGSPDDYNANVNFIVSSSGTIEPSYDNTDTYAGNISINSATQIHFGASTNGRVTFDGGVAQSINDLASSATPLFRDFHVNKGGDALTLNMPVNVEVELDLDNGIVNTTNTNILSVLDDATVSSVSNASHVDGPVSKVGNDLFRFPVGDGGFYRPATISAPGDVTADFRCRYFYADANPSYDVTMRDASIIDISRCEYWEIDRLVTTEDVSVTLFYEDFDAGCSGITDATNLVVTGWNGTEWKNRAGPGTAAPTGSVTTPSPVSIFGPFTWATIDPLLVLPIELVDFTAEAEKEQVVLVWRTATEINNDYFVVERSQDRVHWEPVTRVKGAGNSTQSIAYRTADQAPLPGTSYYRLMQIDFDGTFTHSKAVGVHFETSDPVVLYPNPTTNVIYAAGSSEELSQLVVQNGVGQIIHPQLSITPNQVGIDLSGFPSGIYFVRTQSTVHRVVKR